MKTTADYLDELKQKFEVDSDAAAARAIGITHRQIVSRYRTLRGTFDDAVCLRIAEALEIEPGPIMLDMHIQREKNPAVRNVWEKIAHAAQAGGAFLLFLAVLPFVHHPAPEAIPRAFDITSVMPQVSDNNIHYALVLVGLFLVATGIYAGRRARHNAAPFMPKEYHAAGCQQAATKPR